MKLIKDVLTFQDIESAITILESYKANCLHDMPSTKRMVEKTIAALTNTLEEIDAEMSDFEARLQHEEAGKAWRAQ
jgi:hypothetical protein